MKEITLDEIITAAYRIEFQQYSNDSEHIFSGKHNRAMKRLFKTYEKKKINLYNNYEHTTNLKLNRKSFILIMVAIFLAILAGCTAAIYYLGGFKAVAHTDNTELFSIELDGSPQIIEKIYSLESIPQSYEIFDTDSSDYFHYVGYINPTTNQTIGFSQWVKNIYHNHANTEGYALEETEINGNDGVIIDYSNETEYGCLIIWDNGDYILEISSNLSKPETLNLAKSAKIL